MNILRSIEELAGVRGPVALAIGVFDGVHLGHQEVIRGGLDFSEKHGGTAVVMTFDPHPLRILRPESAPRLLCNTRHKLRILESLGVSHALVVNFDAQFAQTPAVDFVRAIAAASRPLGFVSVGYSWTFGKERGGDIHLLMQSGEELGFGVYGVPAVQSEGAVVSSTRVRESVRAGDFTGAKSLLGRDYTVLGKVVRGDQLGRKIGFATANVAVENEELPPNGVHAVRATIGGRAGVLSGVANLGVRPTVTRSGDRQLEVHLFDFAEDIYGSEMEVAFVKMLREERKFPGIEELKAQIARDAGEARKILDGGV